MNLQNKALKVATEAHKGQLYDDGREFIVHPVLTAQILQLIGADENLICAGFLHDTIEDTPLTYEDLRELFNEDIVSLVAEVTKEKPKNKSKSSYFPNLKTQRGVMLKLADRLSNISNMKSWDKKKQEWYLKKTKFWRSSEDE